MAAKLQVIKVWVPLFPMQIQSFYGVQIWWPVTLQPPEVQEDIVPHFKAPICLYYDFEGEGQKSTLMVCQTISKSINLLHKEYFVQTGVATTVLLLHWLPTHVITGAL